jgi:F-type H+-transporting ATPase subunit epsilon
MGFKLSVVSPEKVVYEEKDVDFIVLPAKLGQLGVLSRHTPLLSSLKKGKIKISGGKKETHEFEIDSGFVEVLPDKVTVLTSFKKTESS